MLNKLTIPSHNHRLAIVSSAAALLAGALSAPCVFGADLQPNSPLAPSAKAQGAASVAARPSLVVGVVVDGLSMDYVELMREHFTAGGFNRLLNNGVRLDAIDFGVPLDEAAATAMLYTGAAPSANGLGASTVFNRELKREQSAFLAPEVMGNFTTETYSPRALTVSTLGDEVRIDGDGPGLVYAIAPDAPRALVMAGHAGNSGVWVNDADGRWATTTFYRDLPTSVQGLNLRNPLSARLDTVTWSPLMGIDQFPAVPSHKKIYPFRHTFSRGSLDRYKAYKNSPLVNADVTSLATDYLKSMAMGSRSTTDMLSVAYTLNPFAYGKEADARLELMDSYLRLDRDLERLFEAIDRSGPGMDKTVVFVAGTPMRRRQRRDDERWNIPTGEFSSRKAISLLNMYFMALYGNGDWVSGYHNGSLYLNDKLIKERDLRIEELRREAAAFLQRMAGVAEAWSIDDVAAGRASENPDGLRRAINAATCGDVVVAIAPGWLETEDDNALSKAETPTVNRAVLGSAPGFILAPGVQPQTIGMPVDARVIAPTVASLLRIRAPNAASMAPLRLK